MTISDILSLLGGIALFLFGISLMGDGLKKVSGSRLEPILYRLSSTPLRGVLLGTGVTAAIQSSSATAVMTVGFVNAGMMKLRQGVSVILGAILGTSITGWVICLSYIEGAGTLAQLAGTATLTCLAAVTGVVLRMVSKSAAGSHVGDILMGFAVLMFGLSAMSKSVGGLGEEPWFLDVLTGLSNPVLGILVGALFTAILQSASAAVGIVQALSVTGAMGFDAALPLLLGVAFGASFPVLLAAIGAKPDGRRSALSYPIATGVGAVVCAVIYYGARALIGFSLSGWGMNPFSVALVNSAVRLAILIFMLPCLDLIVKACTALVPDGPAPEGLAIELEDRFLRYPALAIEQSRLSVAEMARAAQTALELGLGLLDRWDAKDYAKVAELEERVDGYEDAIGTFLVKLTGQELDEEQNQAASKFLHTITDIERISDHALNLAESGKELHDKGLVLSERNAAELSVLTSAVEQVAGMAVTALCENDLTLAARIEPLEEWIDGLCDTLKLHFVECLQQGQCTIGQSFVFNDVLTNCERVSDHCSNIGVAMIELASEEFLTHEYQNRLKERGSEDFQEAYEEFQRRFALPENTENS